MLCNLDLSITYNKILASGVLVGGRYLGIGSRRIGRLLNY